MCSLCIRCPPDRPGFSMSRSLGNDGAGSLGRSTRYQPGTGFDGADIDVTRFMDERSEDSFQVCGSAQLRRAAAELVECRQIRCAPTRCYLEQPCFGGRPAFYSAAVEIPLGHSPHLQTGSSSEQRRGRQTEGPATWAEVDTEEIERVAVGIARNAMPSNAENTELASRLEAQVIKTSNGCMRLCLLQSCNCKSSIALWGTIGPPKTILGVMSGSCAGAG